LHWSLCSNICTSQRVQYILLCEQKIAVDTKLTETVQERDVIMGEKVEVDWRREISLVWIHVEPVIGVLKQKYTILQGNYQ